MSELQMLRDRVEELESLLGLAEDDVQRYRVLGLTRTRCRVLGFLMKREVASREALYIAIYGDRAERSQPDPEVFGVHIWGIRAALDRIGGGIKVKTEWGIGWSMAPREKQKLNDYLKGRNDDRCEIS